MHPWKREATDWSRASENMTLSDIKNYSEKIRGIFEVAKRLVDKRQEKFDKLSYYNFLTTAAATIAAPPTAAAPTVAAAVIIVPVIKGIKLFIITRS